jgi:hypothetical protein
MRSSPANRVINTIAGGFAGGGESNSARKRHLQEIMTIKSGLEKVKRHPVISFSADDFCGYDGKQDDPMALYVETMKFTIKRVLVDQGSSIDILFWTAFEKLGLPDTLLRCYAGSLVGFAGD